jgi:prepilin-type N-terminal cleavage/methylation domain-containing protein
MKRRINHKTAGFTLVELLTVIAVVAILLGFLIPALSSIEKSALKVRQRAQFHGIEVALEAFATDMGDYPPSLFDYSYYGNYSASQRLAEAIVGRDGFGFHPDSRFHETGEDNTGKSLYMTHAAFGTDYPNPADKEANLARRKGPYIDLEAANAVKLSNLYGVGGFSTLPDTYILADKYKITKNLATGKLVGLPILYYKANKGKVLHDPVLADMNRTLNQCTYNVYDSIGNPFASRPGIASLTKLGTHPLYGSLDGRKLFYDQTQNPDFLSPPRPYRADSFILHSAGPDGLYGTVDDVFNFDQEN